MARYHFYAVTIFALVVALAGCGESGDDAVVLEGGESYEILDWNADEQRYEVMESTIETLRSRSEVQGDVAYLRGGGNIVISNPYPTTREEFETAIEVEGDREPRTRYEVDDGVVKGWDYDSFLMFTLYHHLERAAEYFVRIGLDEDAVGTMPVYYSASMSQGFMQFTDNAAYASPIDAFIIPPQQLLRDLPMAANRGIIVHEYSHAVFNRLVHNAERAPDFMVESWSNEYVNRMLALDEGVADIFAALAIQDPDFIAHSVPPTNELFEADRDLSVHREYTQSIRTSLSTSTDYFDPYELGSVIASTLWALRGPVADDELLGSILLVTLASFAEVEPPFTIADFFDLLYAWMPPDAQSEACNIFVDRLTAISGELSCAN